MGTFNEQKNHDFLIKVAQKLPQKYMFMIVGDGDVASFKKKIISSNIEDKFIILPTTNNISRFYSAFDIFLFPSKWEGLGMAAVEAQYANLPCIVSEFVPKDVIIFKNIISFLPLDPKKWVFKIRNTKLLKKIERESEDKNMKFDIHSNAKELELFYQEVVLKNGCEKTYSKSNKKN